MSPNYFGLNIDFPYVKPNPDLSLFAGDYVNSMPKGEFLTLDLLKFVVIEHKLIINTSAVFYSQPGVETPIHVDGPPGDYVKINFIVGGADSKMNWYQLKDTDNVPDLKQTSVGTDYISYKPSEVNLIDSYEFYRPTVVQVGIPHNVSNGPEHRYCFSLSLLYNQQRVTMSQAQDIFSKYIV